jgi:hypothetical protein
MLTATTATATATATATIFTAAAAATTTGTANTTIHSAHYDVLKLITPTHTQFYNLRILSIAVLLHVSA